MKLDDFLKCKKVRCVSIGNHNFITVGKEYDVVGVDRDSVFIVNDNDSEDVYLYKHFEPVLDSSENPLQDVELTPEFEAVEPKFKVGDKVYIPNIKNLCTIRNDGKVITSNGQYYCNLSDSHDLCFVLATQENYEMLCKLYPHIEFEQPPKPLKGSDLARAMLDKGWKFVPCYVHDESDDEAMNRKHYVSVKKETPKSGYNFSGTGANDWRYAVPIDPRTGEPLTESVLDE